MKLQSLRIENFRSFVDETISLDSYSCFVGRNGAGKSTILTALNIFFREVVDASTDLLNMCEEDFHAGDTSKPIRITATFVDLEPEAQEDFAAYHRVSQLVISAVAEWNGGSAEVKQYGNRLGMEEFRRYFEEEKAGAKADALKAIYQELRGIYKDLADAKTKPAMEAGLQEFEAAHVDLCTLIPSEDRFYGVSNGSNRLEKYLQWVYIPAVKDATAEQEHSKSSALFRLLQRRVYSQLHLDAPINAIKVDASIKYNDLLDANKEPLEQVSASLNKIFKRWAHPNASIDLAWSKPEKAVSIAPPAAEMKATEGAFTGDLARFGHGLQRSFIFALLEELADYSDTGPLLILGCEEPELYQHPPQARYMASVLERLSRDHAQVLICTHSPYFVSGHGFEAIRVVQKQAMGAAIVKQSSFDDVAALISGADGNAPTRKGGMEAKIEQEMQGQMNEMFFAQVPVLVEGLEDIAFITSYMDLIGCMDEFRSLGGHIVQCQGKHHLIQGVAISKALDLQCFVIFDADGDCPADTVAKTTGNRQKHQQDNTTLLKLMDIDAFNPFPNPTLKDECVTVWPTKIGDIVRAEIGEAAWTDCEQAVRTKYDNYASDMGKNGLFIAYVVLESWNRKLSSASLIELCEAILVHARKCAALPEIVPTPDSVGAA
jgi:putative ATP-dependent endonuclease of OLD family